MSAHALRYLLAGCLFCLLGCTIAYYGFAMLRKSRHLLNKGIVTTGIYKGDGRVEFVTTSGMKLMTSYQSYRSRRASPIGKEVRVLYDAQRPMIACVATFQELAYAPGNQLSLASGSVVMGLLLLLTSNAGMGALGMIGTCIIGAMPTFLYGRHVASTLQARFEAALTVQESE